MAFHSKPKDEKPKPHFLVRMLASQLGISEDDIASFDPQAFLNQIQALAQDLRAGVVDFKNRLNTIDVRLSQIEQHLNMRRSIAVVLTEESPNDATGRSDAGNGSTEGNREAVNR